MQTAGEEHGFRASGHPLLMATEQLVKSSRKLAVALATEGWRQEVLDLLARGLWKPAICQQFVISEATAKTSRDILQKLDPRDRVQAVINAYETGLAARRSAGQRPADALDQQPADTLSS
jgi:DNA-binding NarL/FixJ family response regulator